MLQQHPRPGSPRPHPHLHKGKQKTLILRDGGQWGQGVISALCLSPVHPVADAAKLPDPFAQRYTLFGAPKGSGIPPLQKRALSGVGEVVLHLHSSLTE